MPIFIQLTEIKTGNKIFLRVDHIISMHLNPAGFTDGTVRICMLGNYIFDVRESPERILELWQAVEEKKSCPTCGTLV